MTEAGPLVVERTFTATMDDPDDPDMAVRNRIHTTDGAQQYGFRGALVGGVHLYGWMVPAIVEAVGSGWLDHGWIHIRFRRPTYPGSEVTVRITADPAEGSFHLQALGDGGQACVVGDLGLGDAPWIGQFQLSSRAEPDPPLDARPVLTLDDAPIGAELRTLPFDPPSELLQSMVDRGMHRLVVDGPPALHPAVVAGQMIPLLAYSYDYGRPSIHVSSHVQNLARPDPDEPLVLTGRFIDAYERNGNHCAVVDGNLLGAGGRELARIRHTNVFRVRTRG